MVRIIMRRMVGVLLAVLLCVVAGCSASAGPATGYYASIDGLAGAELKAALTALISEHTTLSYRNLWDYYPTTYYVPGAPSQVLDMYSSSSFSFSAHSGMDREHVIPKSWWGGSTDYGPGCDLYNVIPAEHAANEAKSNYPFGVVQDACTFDNGVIRVGHFSTSGYAGRVFEPADEDKGDFARIAFYVATCYPDMPWDEHKAKMMTSSSSLTLQPWCIPILLSWSRSDAVDAAEIQRNEDVSRYQGNRNPFIDYPILAEYIWGDKQHEPFYLSAHTANTGVANDNVLPPVSPSRGAAPSPPADIDSRSLLYESFSAVTAGNSDNNNGSSTAWQGNDNFPTGSKVFMAGQALRIGTSKEVGTLTSRPFSSASGSVTVAFDVKGWTTVEGTLLVTVSGAGTQSVRYTATMSDAFEHVSLHFEGVPSSATLTISTSSQRAFLDNITVVDGQKGE